ncbi:cytochrome P450 [Saccharopolyspora sp. 5N708]|uniref:cytochrome P450 n=1 Tax=Saccharopolyspora sp. 5N708 TaxID=3457424 RepID=UPI003FCF0D56
MRAAGVDLLPVFPFSDPDATFARLRAVQPVSRVLLAGQPVWLITRYQDAQSVFLDPRFSLARAADPDVPRLGTFEPRPGLLLSMDPPEHTRLRKLVTKVFTARRIEQLRPHVQNTVDGLLDRLATTSPPVDLIENFTASLPIEIICEMLGVPCEDRPRFQEWTELIMTVSGRSRAEVQAGWARMTDYIAGLVAEKRQRPTDDLLSSLIAARDQGDKLDENELVLFGIVLLVAGHETTKNQLTNSVVMLLAEHPDQWHRLVEQPELVPSAIEELLRLVPLFGSDVTFPRVATAEVELGGVTIGAGDTVLVSLTSANRDAAAFDAPEVFDPERTDNRHLAFGNGIHRCLGAQLAKIELEIGLGGLLRRFPHLELDVDVDELPWNTGGFIRGLHALPVRW